MRGTPLPNALAAEAIGTFALVFAGCGAVMVEAETGALGHAGVAVTFGLAIMVMIYAVGHVSGAHFNPAVTFAFALTRHFPWARAAAYWTAQAAGALVAAAILRGSLGDVANVGATLPSGSKGQSFLWEAVLTFFLMFVITAVATDTRAVGEAVCVCEFVPTLGLAQPTVSYHLKQLAEAGLLERERRGTFAFYRLAPGALERLSGLLAGPANVAGAA